ncbi:MAG: membrane protein [Rhodospirillales bacterium]
MIGNDRIPLFVTLAFCAGLFTVIGAVVGVVLAYVKRDELAGEWGESILTYCIRTFWIALVVAAVGWLLTLILIGWVLLAALFLWYGARCLRALLAAYDRRPIPDPQTYLF